MNRSMPPPSSPQQREQQQREQSQQAQGHPQPTHPPYPPPPPSRQPAPAIGPPTSFPTSRDLPALNSINRPSSVNSSMSISSMLGGSGSREQLPGPPYQSPAPMMPSGAPTGPTTPFTPAILHHASPRINTAGSDYDRFRRPQTPEHHRLAQSHMQQDHRATSASAGSPPRPTLTPETHRYSTPQAYPHTRNPSGSGPNPLVQEERREQYAGPVRVANPNAPPPRPSSQPTMFNQAPREREASIAETIRSDNGRSQPYVPRALGYGNRDDIPAFREQQRFDEAMIRNREQEQRERNADLERKREIEVREREFMRQREMEREREIQRERERERDNMRQREAQEREREIMRERERDRMDQARNAGPFPRHDSMQPQQQQYAPRSYVPQPGPFGAREPEAWMRRPDERDPRELGLPQPPPGYQVQRELAQPYGPPQSYQQPRYDPRDPREYGPQTQQPQHQPQYGSPLQERERMHGPQSMHQHQQQQYAPQGAPGPYRSNESPRARSNEEAQNMQRGVYLGIQQSEINRKGRNSPFPQAVQGAQGPPGEPGIKSEFGKMFSGIGSGVGSIGGGTASGGSLTPYQAGPRREDLEGVAAQDSPTDGLKMARQNSRGGRRRKLQDDDKEGDDSSTGRRTPTGRKRPKQAPQLAIGAHRQYVVHEPALKLGKGAMLTSYSVSGAEPITRLSSPSQPSLTPTFGHHPGGMGPSPPRKAVPHHHHIKHHHHPHGSRHQSQAPQVSIQKPKIVVKNKTILDSVAHLPSKHLGHIMYEATLTPGDPPSLERSHSLPRRGFSSTSKPLPKELIEGREGCKLTVRVPRVYLGHIAREEITSRRAVWGTDVYTDDSDIVAACIHAGWIQGAWPEEVDISALDLVVNGEVSGADMPNGEKVNGKPMTAKNDDIVLMQPPASGPKVPPKGRDMHVTIWILPALEKYASTTRWGIKSREWKDTHDGMSFMIEHVRFVSGVDTTAEIRGKGRRIRITAGMKEDELEREEEAGLLLALANGMGVAQGDVDIVDIAYTNGGAEESFVRGDGGMQGLGMASWWKKQEKIAVFEIPKEPTPEPSPEALPTQSPERQCLPNSHSPQQERQASHDQRANYGQPQHEMRRQQHHVELQPPEIEPLSSPTMAPGQEPETNINENQPSVNGQQQSYYENEVDMTNAWPQLPQAVHQQPAQHQQAQYQPSYHQHQQHPHYYPSVHQPHQHQLPQHYAAQHQKYPPHHEQTQPQQPHQESAPPTERQPTQVELNEMYEHPPAPPKDGSPLENQQVEQAAMEEQRVVNEEPLVVKVTDAALQVVAEARHEAKQVIEENRHGVGEGAVEKLILNEVAAAPNENGVALGEERQKEGMEVLAEALRASESADTEQQVALEEKMEENVAMPDGSGEMIQNVEQPTPAPQQ